MRRSLIMIRSIVTMSRSEIQATALAATTGYRSLGEYRSLTEPTLDQHWNRS
jgi:hypothetical protein